MEEKGCMTESPLTARERQSARQTYWICFVLTVIYSHGELEWETCCDLNVFCRQLTNNFRTWFHACAVASLGVLR